MATVSRPDISDRHARIATRVSSLRWSDIYLVNDMVKTALVWRQAAMLKYVPLPHPVGPARGDVDGGMRRRREKLHCEAMTPAGWSDASRGDKSAGGKCRPGTAIGPMTSTLSGPCHFLHWTSKYSKKLMRSSLGGELYLRCEMIDYASLLRGFFLALCVFVAGHVWF